MVVKCKNCLPIEGIEVPDFNISEKSRLVELKVQSPLRLAKYIIDNFKLSHRDAKYIVTHINCIYGQCNRCKFASLDEEYINCPKCEALNFNWKTDYGKNEMAITRSNIVLCSSDEVTHSTTNVNQNNS